MLSHRTDQHPVKCTMSSAPDYKQVGLFRCIHEDQRSVAFAHTGFDLYIHRGLRDGFVELTFDLLLDRDVNLLRRSLHGPRVMPAFDRTDRRS